MYTAEFCNFFAKNYVKKLKDCNIFNSSSLNSGLIITVAPIVSKTKISKIKVNLIILIIKSVIKFNILIPVFFSLSNTIVFFSLSKFNSLYNRVSVKF